MKTINVSKDKELEIFTDSKTEEFLGFAGWINIDNEKVYVDTRDGTGYDKIINKMSKLIKYLASKYKFNNFTFEDSKQNIAMHILEGIPKFDPRKNIKLSTFLQMRINRRLINEIRDDSRFYRNATLLNVQNFSVTCACGVSISLSLHSDEKISDKNCLECGASLNGAKKRAISQSEVSLDNTILTDNAAPSDSENMVENVNIFGEPKGIDEDTIIAKKDIKEWMKDEDPRIIKLIELICFDDYSIKDAAEIAGISNAGANIKLRNLRKNKKIREILGL